MPVMSEIGELTASAFPGNVSHYHLLVTPSLHLITSCPIITHCQILHSTTLSYSCLLVRSSAALFEKPTSKLKIKKPLRLSVRLSQDDEGEYSIHF